MRKLLLLLAVLALGCVHDKDDNFNPAADIPLNSDGFPHVAGKYSFSTSTIKMTCTDGGVGSVPAVSFNVDVSQTGNELNLSGGSSAVPGATVVEQGDWFGLIGKTGSFTLNRALIVDYDALVGLSDLTYTVSGQFTKTGWAGNYEISAYMRNYLVTCNYKTTFTGEKL